MRFKLSTCSWVITLMLLSLNSFGAERFRNRLLYQQIDTLKKPESKDRHVIVNQRSQAQKQKKEITFPASSLQQLVKDKFAGIYVQESSGEPGSYQYMFVRGTSNALLNNYDLIRTQPLVIVDGLPIVSNESPIAYDIQQYNFNRIGPSTNFLAGVNLEEIESVEVLKDLSQTAVYGPKAANGVIYIKTKRPTSSPRVSLNAYTGIVARPTVSTLNGSFENNFRKQFYDRYALPSQLQSYPAFLKDSLNSIYYGPSNWTDEYYRNAIVYNLNASVTGGSDKANFKFSLGDQKTNGNADMTALDRYNAAFIINISPTKWLNVNANINGAKLVRTRNRYNRDRFAEVRYLPELSQAPSPNLSNYKDYLTEYDKSIDENSNALVNGFLDIGLKLGKIRFNSKFGVSYNEGTRDTFFPSTLLDNNNYVSNYFGFSQRLVLDNTAAYTYSWGKKHRIDLLAGQSIQWDQDRYNYAYAYRGPNDFLKVNLLNNSSALEPTTFDRRLISKFLDGTENSLLSFFGKANYSYNDIYTLSLVLRGDGSSNAQPTDRWFYSPVISGAYNLKFDKLKAVKMISTLNIKAGYGRLGIAEIMDRYAVGPLYSSDIGWTGEPRIPSFLSVTTLSRPYTYGYTGYDIPWAYNEQFTLGIDFGLWNNRLKGSIDTYSTTTKDQFLGMPTAAEYGYSKVYYSGMKINNSGVDLNLSVDLLSPTSPLKWVTAIGLNINRNRLKALPLGYGSIVIGDRKLEVGKSVDQYWLLKNEGIFNADSEVPVNPATNSPLTYKGIALKAGDPRWVDVNGDFNVDDQDKILTGHILPMLSGNLTQNFSHGKWTLTADLYYNIGREVLNQNMANRYNFINQETSNDINSAKEITYWEKQGDYSLYPKYNPWSLVVPYRIEQDLFLENASFMKLRNLTLGYDLTDKFNRRFKKGGFKSFFVYAAVSNVFTLTPYSGRDPELASYTGYDSGYGMPIPRTFTTGVRVDF